MTFLTGAKHKSDFNYAVYARRMYSAKTYQFRNEINRVFSYNKKRLNKYKTEDFNLLYLATTVFRKNNFKKMNFLKLIKCLHSLVLI